LTSPALALPSELRARAVVEAERGRPITEIELAYVAGERDRLAPAMQRLGLMSPAANQLRDPGPDKDGTRDRER